METYCVGCKKNTANENSSVRRTKKKINGCIKLSYLWQKIRCSLMIKNSIK